MSGIESLTQQALGDIAAADTPDAVEALRVALLGKQGSVTAQLKQLGALPADQRKSAGEAINRARDALTDALGERKRALDDAALDARLASESIDVTLPGIDAGRGGLHPVSRTHGAHRRHLRAPGLRAQPTAPRSRTTGTTSRP